MFDDLLVDIFHLTDIYMNAREWQMIPAFQTLHKLSKVVNKMACTVQNRVRSIRLKLKPIENQITALGSGRTHK